MTEWEFVGDVNSWINEIVGRTPIPPFVRCKVEQTGSGSRKRRDLTLLDKSKRALLTGEIKLPYQADGNSPYVTKVVADARRKARKANARFFFTWNVNECVLWETEPADSSKLGQDYKSWHVTSVHNETQLAHFSTEEEIKDWLVKFLHSVAQILEGKVKIGRKPPDEKFIDALESALRMPVQFTYDELERLFQKKRERAQLEKWMREEQGWTVLVDPEGIRENLERAARFACYALVNKLVFHEALLKRYGRHLNKLRVPDHVDTGDQLWTHLEAYFKDAIKVTGDYETVFGEDHRSVGNRIPFHANDAVPHWRALIDQIHDFDFSKLDHEVVGTLFERLLSPEERHKYGQYYTKVEIVDLINSFCIRRGDEKVMDPACGGGTFLVRAYSRMKTLLPDLSHGEILKNIFGVDIMNFATHLSTINLVVRDLIDDENYPQVVRGDFFDIETGKVFATLPRKARAGGLGKTQQREVEIPPLDAVIGNPPYIRQEDIPKSKKPLYASLVKKEAGVSLSGRSDIHCYFWPHASAFLKQDGYLCLLTSSQWLDVEYGFRLQEWILKNFEIQAVFESIDEPWFVGARVATTVTILKRQPDEAKRMVNSVRFAQLRRPIAEILGNDGSIPGAVRAADEFAGEVLSLRYNASNERFRARILAQSELWEKGVRLGTLMGSSHDNYYGGKWGVYLRAPDLWFELLDKYEDRFIPLASIANVKFGVKSGRDDFFFPRDVSNECLSRHATPQEFHEEYGVPRKDVASGRLRLVQCGEGRGELKPIEAVYLEPEVHSLMEIDGFVALRENCTRRILLISEPKAKIAGQYARAYIRWGESLGIHKGSTCAARQTEDRQWYDLTGHVRGAVFWPMAQQYKHAVPLNRDKLICNHNLFDISAKSLDNTVLAALLNSTIVVLSKHQYGRPVGVEGNLKTEVVDVNMMLVPDPSKATPAVLTRVSDAFAQLASRPALQFLSERRMRMMAFTKSGRDAELETLSDLCELDMADRRELDDAVFELMGIQSKKERNRLIDELYGYLREFFESTRLKEEKAIANKNVSKRRGKISPSDIAGSIFEAIKNDENWLLQKYDPGFIDKELPFDTFDVPNEGTPVESHDMFAGEGLRFVKGKNTSNGHVRTSSRQQDDLIKFLVECDIRGLVRIPRDPSECRSLLKKYSKFVQERDHRLAALVEERTSDEDLQEKILAELHHLISLN